MTNSVNWHLWNFTLCQAQGHCRNEDLRLFVNRQGGLLLILLQVNQAQGRHILAVPGIGFLLPIRE